MLVNILQVSKLKIVWKNVAGNARTDIWDLDKVNLAASFTLSLFLSPRNELK